jgi:geranylgeranyl reductase family protein
MASVDTSADVLVVGAGPAGSIAAYTLARGGARVVLADKAAFPRDKACGDLVGPRGLQTLRELGLREPAGPSLGDMVVLGPGRRGVRLPCFAGSCYPGRAVAVPRTILDASLRAAALDAGAEAVTGRAGQPIERDGRIAGFRCGEVAVRADVVIGADGATSRVAEAAGLVDPRRVLWAFAVRAYGEPGPHRVELPHIVWWEPEPRRILPGYGWVFPGAGGRVNIGLGVGALADRRRGAEAARRFPAFVARMCELGLVEASLGELGRRSPLLGGWLKLGMVGTTPARGNVLLAGDAAGVVNPLQGEGIGPALASGRAAAEAVLAGPSGASRAYLAVLGSRHAGFEPMAASVHLALMEHPLAASAVTRLLTAPLIGGAVAGGWSLLWNDLVEGAPPCRERAAAGAVASLGRLATRRSDASRWLAALFDGAGHAGAGHPQDAPPVAASWAGGDVGAGRATSCRRDVRGEAP